MPGSAPIVQAARLTSFLALLTVVLIAGVWALAPTVARANNYHDFLCRIPYGPNTGHPAPVDDVTYNINDSYLYAGNSCAGGGSLYAAMDGGTSHPYGTGAYDTFSAPAGLTIAAFSVWRYEADGPTQPYGAPASNLSYSPGPTSVQGLCAQSLGCSSRGTTSNPFDPSNAVGVGGLGGVTQIQWSAACGGGPSGTCPASGQGTLSSQYNVYAADIDLVDNTPPTVTAISGPLVAGGTLAGQQAVSFSASDSQAGVYSGSLLVDGHTVLSQILDTNGGACQSLGITADGQHSFEHAQPCKTAVSASLTLNTNQLAAGQHSLELIVDDAAGDQTIAYNGTISTSGPPGANDLLGPHIANGQSPCAGVALSLTANGKSAAKVRPVRYGRHMKIKGVLHCGTTPIRNARIVLSTIGSLKNTAINTAVQTGLDGSFTYEVPIGPNRTLNFSYRAYSDDPAPSATAQVNIAVYPKVTLAITPRRTSNQHTIHWIGRVIGAPIPRHGVTLIAEVKEGHRWLVFAQIITNGKGHFRYAYHFRLTYQPTAYTFRVALPHTGSGSYPYTPAASNRVNVQVN
jgi:hypothetical protein